MDLTQKYTGEGIVDSAVVFLPKDFVRVKRHHQQKFFELLNSIKTHELNEYGMSYALAIPDGEGDQYYSVSLSDYFFDNEGPRVNILSVSDIDIDTFLEFVKIKRHLVF